MSATLNNKAFCAAMTDMWERALESEDVSTEAYLWFRRNMPQARNFQTIKAESDLEQGVRASKHRMAGSHNRI